MDDKKLRKISRKELLEILLSQAKRIDELEQKLEKTEAKLNSKRITIDNSGSLAEASLKLNGIFENAEEAAKQYLFNIKEKCKKIETETKKACQLEKENMLKETEELCEQKKKETEKYLKEIELKVKKLNKGKEKGQQKNTTKIKNSSSKKKNTTKSKLENINENSTSGVIKNNLDDKNKSENKLVVEKTKKNIKGRPIKTIKKRNDS